MLGFFRSLFLPKEQGQPPLPAANKRYILYRTDPGAYDIDDDGQLVGFIYREEGDEEHRPHWVAQVRVVHHDFPTLKDAKAWLGNPPVRKYR